MRTTELHVIFGTLVLAICAVATSSAECVVVSPSWMKKHSEHVFAGRLTEETPVGSGGLRLTFDVSRVWKGNTGKTVVLFQAASLDRVRLDTGNDYIIFARAANKDDRERLQLIDGASVLVVPDCSGAIPMRGNERAVRQLGRSREPK